EPPIPRPPPRAEGEGTTAGAGVVTETLYRKIGRRYHPVAWYDPLAMDALGKGDYLISVYEGGRSMRKLIRPDHARLLAAAREMREAMVAAMRKASELKPHRTPITKRQQEAWQALSDAFGDGLAQL